MIKSNKGAIEISFGWIFMIMVGVIFILIAYNIVGKYKQIQDGKYLIELKQTIKDILVNSGNTKGQAQNSLIPLGGIFQNSKVSIQCIGGVSLLEINGHLDANNQYLQNNPIFMTQIKQGSIENSYMAIESFKMPFKISNLLAITSKKNLIIFNKDSKLSKEFQEKFSRSSYQSLNINYQGYDFKNLGNQEHISEFISAYKNQNLNSIVFVSNQISSLSASTLKNISIGLGNILVELVAINGRNYGNITYLTMGNKKYSFAYVDFRNSLDLQMMSLFSTPSNFNCSYHQIIKQTIPIYTFYLDKTSYFINYFTHLESLTTKSKDVICSNQGGLSPTTFKNYYSHTYYLLNKTLNSLNSSGFSKNKEIYGNLTELNKNFIKLENNNCQYVY